MEWLEILSLVYILLKMWYREWNVKLQILPDQFTVLWDCLPLCLNPLILFITNPKICIVSFICVCLFQFDWLYLLLTNQGEPLNVFHKSCLKPSFPIFSKYLNCNPLTISLAYYCNVLGPESWFCQSTLHHTYWLWMVGHFVTSAFKHLAVKNSKWGD